MEGGLLVLLSGDGEEKRLICAALPDRRVIDVSLRTNLAFIETRGNSLFLGVGDDIVRMDLQDR